MNTINTGNTGTGCKFLYRTPSTLDKIEINKFPHSTMKMEAIESNAGFATPQMMDQNFTRHQSRMPSKNYTAMKGGKDERNCIGMPPMAMFRAVAGRAEGRVRTAFQID